MVRTLAAVMAALFLCGTADAQYTISSRCFGPWLDEPVDLFVAMQNGWVDGRVIVRDQYHAKLVLQNVSAFPLAVALPEFLGARPVMAQQGFQFPGLSGQQGSDLSGNGIQSSLPQAVGGSPSSRGNNSIFGNGPFNIAPEQVRIVDFPCFCLEQGKPNPRSAVKYELAPLDAVNDDPRLPELLAAYAKGGVDREIAQAAVWHAANEMSWDDLAALSQRIAINAERPVFNARQLRQARALVESAEKQVATKNEPAKRSLATVVKPPRL